MYAESGRRRRHRQSNRRRPAARTLDMKSTISLLLLWACNTLSEPLGAAIQRRSDRSGVYASDYAKEYHRDSYVAIPLHAPLPVIHVLSHAPLYRPHRAPHRHVEHPHIYAASTSHLWYARPTLRPAIPEDEATAPEIIYTRPNLIRGVEPVIRGIEPVIRSIEPVFRGVETVPEVLYARPNPRGGYIYSKKPTKKRPSRLRNEPLVIRVHKHRVIRDR